MGDFLRNGKKIGTCGHAYYATREHLEAYAGDPEADFYLDPKNACITAFPFPDFDGKKAGDYSVFSGHGERPKIAFPLIDAESWHTADCSCSKKQIQVFEIYGESYHDDGERGVLVLCKECHMTQILSDDEARQACAYFVGVARDLFTQGYIEKAVYLRKIYDRIKEIHGI